MDKKEFTELCKTTFIECRNIILPKASKIEGVQESVNFCIQVSINLLGNMVIWHTENDPLKIRHNALATVQELHNWFKVALEKIEDDKRKH